MRSNNFVSFHREIDLQLCDSEVAILMCTFQGQQFLHKQLDSFEAQSLKEWTLFVSDDMSSDSTLEILQDYQKNWIKGKLNLQIGPSKGFAANFLSLTCRAEIRANFYAYADQDDIWQADKLERAVSWLKTIPTHVPALYCSRTILINEENREMGISPLFKRQPSFENALVQNIGGGNTMVFNVAARELILKAGNDIEVVSHDWFIYQLVSGSDGIILYDENPSTLYRQHKSNVVGMNTSWEGRKKRIQMIWKGRYRKWNDTNIQQLEKNMDLLTEKNKKTLLLFKQAKSHSDYKTIKSKLTALIDLMRSNIYRQKKIETFALYIAILFNRI